MMRMSAAPGFHVLNKGPGGSIQCDWAVDNDGGAGRIVLRVINQTMGRNIAQSPVFLVPAGAVDFPLSVDVIGLTENVGAVQGANNMILEAENLDTGQLVPGGSHLFTMNFTVTASGPIFVMVGSPTIV